VGGFDHNFYVLVVFKTWQIQVATTGKASASIGFDIAPSIFT
jgi:hypothetical protein